MGKRGLQITNQNIATSTIKSQNKSLNNSIIFTPFNNDKNKKIQYSTNHKSILLSKIKESFLFS